MPACHSPILLMLPICSCSITRCGLNLNRQEAWAGRLNRKFPPAKVRDREWGNNNCVNIKVVMLLPVCLNIRRAGPMLKFFIPFNIQHSAFIILNSVSCLPASVLNPRPLEPYLTILPMYVNNQLQQNPLMPCCGGSGSMTCERLSPMKVWKKRGIPFRSGLCLIGELDKKIP